MRRDMMIATDHASVTAPNAAAKLIKLLQIAMGAVNTDDAEKVMQFDITNRLAVVKEIIEGSSGKILIAVPYLKALFRLHEELAKDYGCEMVYGGVSESKRGDIFRRFQTDPATRVLVVQPDATAHGITLTEANTILWFGPTTKFEVYEQFNARINRPGQTRKMTVYMLQACEAEKRLNKAIMGLKDSHINLTELYRAVVDT
jgi:SNF2 family DNA or RNA helicase